MKNIFISFFKGFKKVALLYESYKLYDYVMNRLKSELFSTILCLIFFINFLYALKKSTLSYALCKLYKYFMNHFNSHLYSTILYLTFFI